MGMTITEKILAAHADLEQVAPGEIINARVDVALGNDITAPLAIQAFREMGAATVFDKAKVILVPDHFTPNKDILSAEQCLLMRKFAQEQGLVHYLEVGRMGIEHALLPEMGLVGPGYLVVGADSHTCTYGALGAFATGVGSTDLAAAMATGEIWLRVPETIQFIYTGKLKPWVGGKDLILYTIGAIGVDGALYKAMEITGETISSLDMSGRFTMANMAIEAGAKTGLIPADEMTADYVRLRGKRPGTRFQADPDASYIATHEFEVGTFEPYVAVPYLPENVKPVSELVHLEVDQVVIGMCTNGNLEDLRAAASVLRGRSVHPRLRAIVIPGSQKVYLDALREGLIETFIQADCAVSTPTCGPCLGGHMGVLASGERCVSTSNRNFRGRMGDPTSEVYLANPYVAAATAVAGHIASPADL
jgi:3-isopropylmalate/(R)-2-methylmalate dehydratase large subunit